MSSSSGGSGPSAPVSQPVYSYDQIAHYLTHQFWIDFGTTPRHFDVQSGATLTVNLTGLTGYGQATAREALEAWTAVSGLMFAETTSSAADIVFDDNDTGAYAYSFTSNGHINQSHINIDAGWAEYGPYYFQTYMHEIGHALGLGHTGAYNGNGDFSTDAVYANDSWQTSVMSYFSQNENTWTDASFNFLATLQLGDIAAIHSLYGAPVNVETGNTIYGDGATSTRFGMDLAGNYAVAIVDSAGTDEINLASRSFDQNLSLVAETYSDINGRLGNFSIGRNTVIENATTGSGNDAIRGNHVNNWLDGGAGNDALYGGFGADTLLGDLGNDVLYGENDNDTLAGGNGDDFLYGGAGDDYLQGGTGNDSISGGLGTDWAYFELSMASYSFVQLASAVQVIGEYVDTVFDDVELLWFVDQIVSIADLFIVEEPASDATSFDFFGDGAEDFLWRNDDGTVVFWDMNADSSANYPYFGAVDLAWHIEGSGGFFADGADDILWRHSDGTVVAWDMNTDGSVSYTNFGTVDLAWQLEGTGGFYADGADDFLWRHDDGRVLVWDLNSDGSISYHDFGTVGSDWHLERSGDFYADGADDFLWRHDDGTIVIWDMNTDGTVSYSDFVAVDNSWQVQGAGDFYADGAEDILWRHDDGTIVVWDMNADSSVSYSESVAVDNGWHVEGTGDFYADEADDFLWRYDDGTVAVWDMNADGTASFNNLGAVDTAWNLDMFDL